MAREEGYGPPASVVITIEVLDDNDNGPIAPLSLVASVNESIDPWSYITNISVSDHDVGVNTNMSFTITQQDSHTFFINPSSGVLQNRVRLDYEKDTAHTIHVRVCNVGSTLCANVTVDVTVLDVNDNSPYFSQPMSVLIQENTGVGAVIEHVPSFDADSGPNGEISHEILAVNGLRYDLPFDIDSDSGKLKTLKEFNKNIQSKYLILIQLTDHGEPARTTIGTFVVDIGPNDIYAPASYEKYVYNKVENVLDESQFGRIFSPFINIPSANTSFSIENPQNPAVNYLRINESGIITMIKTLDREMDEQLLFNVSIVTGRSLCC